MTNEEFISKYGGLIIDRANYYFNRYVRNIDLQDIVQESFLISLDAMKRYNTDKGKVSTFLYSSLQSLNQYCQEEWKNKELLILDENVISNEFELRILEKYSIYDILYKKLSKNGKIVLHWLITSDHGKSFKMITAYKYFKKNYGWTYYKVNKIWEEIKIKYRKYVQ